MSAANGNGWSGKLGSPTPFACPDKLEYDQIRLYVLTLDDLEDRYG
jgi:hypothetical protein